MVSSLDEARGEKLEYKFLVCSIKADYMLDRNQPRQRRIP